MSVYSGPFCRTLKFFMKLGKLRFFYEVQVLTINSLNVKLITINYNSSPYLEKFLQQFWWNFVVSLIRTSHLLWKPKFTQAKPSSFVRKNDWNSISRFYKHEKGTYIYLGKARMIGIFSRIDKGFFNWLKRKLRSLTVLYGQGCWNWQVIILRNWILKLWRNIQTIVEFQDSPTTWITLEL